MSGGAFDYLFAKEVEFPVGDLEEVFDVVYKLAPDSEATRKTSEFLYAIKRLREDDAKLREVWRCVEWMRSNDYGEDQVLAAIKEYG